MDSFPSNVISITREPKARLVDAASRPTAFNVGGVVATKTGEVGPEQSAQAAERFWLYEVISFADGQSSVWRTTSDLYPEQATCGKWISDYGLGDYDNDRAWSSGLSVHKSVSSLPRAERLLAEEADRAEAEHKATLVRIGLSVKNNISYGKRWRDAAPLSRIVSSDVRYWFWRFFGRRWSRPLPPWDLNE